MFNIVGPRAGTYRSSNRQRGSPDIRQYVRNAAARRCTRCPGPATSHTPAPAFRRSAQTAHSASRTASCRRLRRVQPGYLFFRPPYQLSFSIHHRLLLAYCHGFSAWDAGIRGESFPPSADGIGDSSESRLLLGKRASPLVSSKQVAPLHPGKARASLAIGTNFAT